MALTDYCITLTLPLLTSSRKTHRHPKTGEQRKYKTKSYTEPRIPICRERDTKGESREHSPDALSDPPLCFLEEAKARLCCPCIPCYSTQTPRSPSSFFSTARTAALGVFFFIAVGVVIFVSPDGPLPFLGDKSFWFPCLHPRSLSTVGFASVWLGLSSLLFTV